MPQLPDKRVKQSWIDPHTKLDLQLMSKENESGKHSFDLIKEINASKLNNQKLAKFSIIKLMLKISIQKETQKSIDSRSLRLKNKLKQTILTMDLKILSFLKKIAKSFENLLWI